MIYVLEDANPDCLQVVTGTLKGPRESIFMNVFGAVEEGWFGYWKFYFYNNMKRKFCKKYLTVEPNRDEICG